MGQPLFLSENFYNTIQFPKHTFGGTTGAAGHEAFRVGVARRSILNFYQRDDPSLAYTLDINLDRVREADTLVIDRNSDLVGRGLQLLVSSDDFFTSQEIFFEAEVTADVVLGSSLNDPVHAIRTSEGAWIWKFDPTAGLGFRINGGLGSAATSGSLGGCYLGKSFTPTYGGRLPFDDEDTWTDFGEVRRGVPDNDIRFGRTGAFGIMMSGEAEWNAARRTFRELFGKGSPLWIAPDSDMAERTWLGYNAPGSMAATFSERPQGRTVVIRADEYDGVLP